MVLFRVPLVPETQSQHWWSPSRPGGDLTFRGWHHGRRGTEQGGGWQSRQWPRFLSLTVMGKTRRIIQAFRAPQNILRSPVSNSNIHVPTPYNEVDSGKGASGMMWRLILPSVIMFSVLQKCYVLLLIYIFADGFDFWNNYFSPTILCKTCK